MSGAMLAAAPPAEAKGPAIRCVGLRKRYGDVQAVDGIDLELQRGECFGLLGPNGAGKTTTVEMLEGLRPADSGRIELLGEQWGQGNDNALRQRLGVQLQETQLIERLTVVETLRLFRSFYPRGRSVEEVLGLLDLGAKRRAMVGTLSGGQKQRLALATALVSAPDLLFLDEPTTGLDPQARLRIWEVIEAFRTRGGTVLLTTHAMEEAARLCDRVAVVDRGKIIALGSPEALIRSLGAQQVVALRLAHGELSVEQLTRLPGVARAELDLRRTSELDEVGPRYRLTVADIGQALGALLALIEQQHVTLATLTTHQATLEDVFVHLTGRGLRDE